MLQGCNDIVTVWHRHNNQSGSEKFTRYVLPVMCKWERKTTRTITDKGAVYIQYVSVIVPYEGNYGFDINVKDFMALGTHEVEITGIEPYRAPDVKKLLAPDIIEIKAVYYNTVGYRGKHYRIEGT